MGSIEDRGPLDLTLQIESLKKEIEIVREDAQVELLSAEKRIKDLESIEKAHRKYVGQLLKELDDHKDKIQKLVNDPNYLRKLGVY